MLDVSRTALIVIDVQERLLKVIDHNDDLVESVAKLIRGAKALGLPIVHTEQYPKGLGPTAGQLAELLDGQPIVKTAFSCCGEPSFTAALGRLGREQLLIAGIEGHVCVYQTAADLVAGGYHVEVVADAVSSRTPANRAIGLEKMKAAGAAVTSVEAALFELLRVAEGPTFKEISRIVK